jgi:ABC-type sugar transport system ATPase subunit
MGAPKMNFLQASVNAVGDRLLTLLLADGLGVTVPMPRHAWISGQKIKLGIRPEHVAVDERGDLRGKIEALEHLGSRAYLHARLSHGTTIVAETGGETRLRPGDSVGLRLRAEACHLFDESGRAVQRNRNGARPSTKENHA